MIYLPLTSNILIYSKYSKQVSSEYEAIYVSYSIGHASYSKLFVDVLFRSLCIFHYSQTLFTKLKLIYVLDDNDILHHDYFFTY